MELIKSSPFEYINRTFDSISNFVIYKQYSFSAHARKLHVFINNCLFHTARMKKLKNYCVGHWSFIIHVYIFKEGKWYVTGFVLFKQYTIVIEVQNVANILSMRFVTNIKVYHENVFQLINFTNKSVFMHVWNILRYIIYMYLLFENTLYQLFNFKECIWISSKWLNKFDVSRWKTYWWMFKIACCCVKGEEYVQLNQEVAGINHLEQYAEPDVWAQHIPV